MLPIEPTRPSLRHPPENALAAALTLLHCYAVREDTSTANPRLSHAILSQFEHLADHPDLPDTLRRTCEQLHDAWLQLHQQAARRN